MLYNTGTIAINGNTATGTGTNWTAPASQVRAGQTIIVMSNPVQLFQISSVNSATSMTVTPAASPALSGQKYGILVSDNISVDGLAQAMSQLIKEYDENIGAWETFASTSANQTITVTINGTSVTIPAIGGLARKGANSDITELKGLTTALSIAQGGTGAKTAADARTSLGLGSSSTLDYVSTLYETGNSQKALRVGYFGLGSENGISVPDYDNANNIVYNGFYAGRGNSASNYADAYSPLLAMSRDARGVSQLQATTNGRLFLRGAWESAWTNWREAYTTGNTTKASDGTLKAASPIVQVYSDGSFQLNDESEGCTVSRLSVGEYLIEGCTGLNVDAAWGGIDGGFDIPTDRNKQPLIWLDYEVNADGSVLVKTYHRRNPGAPEFARNEIDGLADGDPVDIPTDQFVSVRVQMPACSIWNQKQEEAIDAMRKFESEEPTDPQQG
ncbi:phage tail protein [Escherichia coli]|uniref:pyocin knob domain-containing protein n=2 Tax=Escherichia coli TaxID=562 RepID=UPI0007077CA4|nr:pyocin knob domain-containing protein [Escherichia coli]EGF7326009.1 phage tail protein [Escherichia coli]KQI94309.1 phage tail protein [Escherichia coli]